MVIRLISVVAALLFVTPCFASAAEVKTFIDSIKSAAAVKERVRALIIENKECGSGSCWNSTGTEICNWVAALDLRVDYLITAPFKSPDRKPQIPISDHDTRLMKLIFGQCKPTNYQYVDYPTILHVIYAPSPKVSAQVNNLLGIKK